GRRSRSTCWTIAEIVFWSQSRHLCRLDKPSLDAPSEWHNCRGRHPSRFDVKSCITDFQAMHAATAVANPPEHVAWAATSSPPAPAIAIGYDKKIDLCEAPHLRAADDMPKQSPAHHAGKGDTMRKSILFAAVVVITATAAVWSIATFARS